LLEVLGDAGLVKTGVALRDDVRELWRIREFAPAGFLDLSETAGRLQLRTNGLRNLAANLLGFRISKRAQCSNWARRELTPKQIVYAATDAWISRELYIHLRSHGLISNEDFINLDPNPEGERGGEAQN
jgi:ribonuclease D